MLTPVAVKHLAADGAVSSAPGALCAVVLTAGDAAAASLILYDNSSAAGTKIVTLKAVQGTSVTFTPAQPLAVGVGIFADVTGADAVFTVSYL